MRLSRYFIWSYKNAGVNHIIGPPFENMTKFLTKFTIMNNRVKLVSFFVGYKKIVQRHNMWIRGGTVTPSHVQSPSKGARLEIYRAPGDPFRPPHHCSAATIFIPFTPSSPHVAPEGFNFTKPATSLQALHAPMAVTMCSLLFKGRWRWQVSIGWVLEEIMEGIPWSAFTALPGPGNAFRPILR